MSDKTQTPDIRAIWDAYAGLAVTIYASRLAMREVPERVHRVHGILERKLIQNGFDPKHPELWCRPDICDPPFQNKPGFRQPDPAS